LWKSSPSRGKTCTPPSSKPNDHKITIGRLTLFAAVIIPLADVGSDGSALYTFWKQSFFGYLWANVAGIVISAFLEAYFVEQEEVRHLPTNVYAERKARAERIKPLRRARRFANLFIQILCQARLVRLGWRSIRDGRLSDELVRAALVEALVESSFSSMVQAHASVSTGITGLSRLIMLGSICMSAASLGRSLASFDLWSPGFDGIHGSLPGFASLPALLCVLLRFCEVVSRFLGFALFLHAVALPLRSHSLHGLPGLLLQFLSLPVVLLVDLIVLWWLSKKRLARVASISPGSPLACARAVWVPASILALVDQVIGDGVVIGSAPYYYFWRAVETLLMAGFSCLCANLAGTTVVTAFHNDIDICVLWFTASLCTPLLMCALRFLSSPTRLRKITDRMVVHAFQKVQIDTVLNTVREDKDIVAVAVYAVPASDVWRLAGSCSSCVVVDGLELHAQSPLGRAAAAMNRDSHDVSMQRKHIGDAGVIALVEGLQTCAMHLHALRLIGNSMSDIGCYSLAGCLIEGCTKLSVLRLSDNSIGDSGMRALSHALLLGGAQLTVLHANSNLITADGANALAQICRDAGRNLRELYLSDNRVRCDGVVALAAGLRDGGAPLDCLRLSSNQVGLRGAVALADWLRGCDVEELGLSDNSFGPPGAEVVAEAFRHGSSGRLKAINMGDCRIGVSGLNALLDAFRATSAQPGTIHLDGSGICDVGAKALADFLQGSGTELRCLTIKDNSIGDAGAKALVATLLASCNKLEKFELIGNKLSVSAKAALQDQLASANLHELLL